MSDDRAIILCRCEELTDADLAAALGADCQTIDDVKRRTRFGMGLCQGVYCLNEVVRALGTDRRRPPLALAPITQRPPARLIRLGDLADSAPADLPASKE